MELSDKVVLDANFIINCIKFKIDLFRELDRVLNGKYEIVVPESVYREVSRVEVKAEIKKTAMEMFKRYVRRIKGKNVDEMLVRLGERGAVICTDDKELKKNLRWLERQLYVQEQRKKLRHLMLG